MRSLRQVAFAGLAIYQLVMVAAIAVEPGSGRWSLTAAHAAFGGVAALGLRFGISGPLLLLGEYGLFIADLSEAASFVGGLTLAACWLCNFSSLSVPLLARGWAGRLLPLVAIGVLPWLTLMVQPGWGSALPVSIVVTQSAIALAMRFGLSHLFDFAVAVDDAHVAAEARTHEVALQRASSHVAAEDARVLHDTVINTLVAIGRGGAAIADEDAVRARCARDVRTVEALLVPRDGGRTPWPDVEPGHGESIEVSYTGLGREGLAMLPVPVAVSAAIRAAVAELVRNAAKHSKADRVDIDVRRDGEMMAIVVRDAGVGFDGVAVPGRGLADSVIARMADYGIHVRIESSPSGTAVALECALGDVHEPTAAGDRHRPDFVGSLNDLRQRAGVMLTLGLAGVGFVLAVANHPGELTPEYAMAAVVGAAGLLGWRVLRLGVMPSRWLAVVFAGFGAVAFFFSAAACGFGSGDVVWWQAIGPAGPALLVIALWRGWRAVAISMAALATVIVVIVGWALQHAATAAVSVATAGVVCLGFVAAWAAFCAAIARIAEGVLADQRSVQRAEVESVARRAAEAARDRWQRAELVQVANLLSQVVDGGVDLGDTGFRSDCLAEEAYLRQLIAISPDLHYMGLLCAEALGSAREVRRPLVIRSGDMDIADADVAQALGEFLVSVVRGLPFGEPVTLSLFPHQGDVQFVLVAASDQLAQLAHDWTCPPGTQLDVRQFGAQVLVEVVVPGQRIDAVMDLA